MGLIPYKNEPGLDWSDESNIKAMRAGLEEVGASLGKSYPLIIGGNRVETDGEIISVNPANPSQVVGSVAAATEREADMALETARKAFESWSRTEPEARARIMLRAAAIIHQAAQVRDTRLGGLRGRQALGRGRRAGGRGHRLPRVLRPRDAQAQGRRRDLDRKSTRLNSSHANISYAVFCLKKSQVLLCATPNV